MALRIPTDAKVVRDNRLTLIRVITTLYDRLVNGDDGLKARVKATLQAKGADFAESDLVIAALRAGSARSAVDPRKLYKLVEAGKLTMNQFLDACTIRREPLKEHLSGADLDKVSTKGAAPEPSLFTEFRPGVEIDIEQLAEQLAQVASKAVPITSR